MKASDIIGIAVLFVIYFLQGIAFGLTFEGLAVILVAKGASYTDVGMISITNLPFSLKILWAPILDKYFIKSFGKRKTYIIPCKYIIGITYIVYSFYFDDHIENKNVSFITMVMLIIVTLEATADIAADGWVLTLLSEENVTLGPACQSIGQILGSFISQFIFIQITSVKFANDYIYSQPSNEPLVTYGGYFKFWGIFTLIFTFIIHFFKKEINPKTREFNSIWHAYSLLKGLGTNKNLRFLSLIWITCKIGFSFIDPAGFLEMIKRGLPKETLSAIGIFTYPLQFIVPFWIVRYTLKKMEFNMFFYGMIIRVLFMIGMVISIKLYVGPESEGWILALFILAYCLNIVGKHTMELSAFAFNTRICDESVGGTFITALASVANIPKTVFLPIGLSILDFANFYAVNILGIAYQIWFKYRFSKKCIELQEAPKEIWDFDHVAEHGVYVEMTTQKHLPHTDINQKA